MIYAMGKIKVIHFEAPPPTSPLIFKIVSDPIINVYPVEDVNRTPFMIQWRFRFKDVKTEKEVGGSYLIETDFSIRDDGQPHDYNMLDNLLSSLYINVEMQ